MITINAIGTIVESYPNMERFILKCWNKDNTSASLMSCNYSDIKDRYNLKELHNAFSVGNIVYICAETCEGQSTVSVTYNVMSFSVLIYSENVNEKINKVNERINKLEDVLKQIIEFSDNYRKLYPNLIISKENSYREFMEIMDKAKKLLEK